MACKEGKVKNANGRCVKKESQCKAGKEKNENGRCVKRCEASQRNSSGKCMSKTKKTVYRKPLPISASKFRGKLLTKKRHLKHHTTTKKSTSSAYGHFKW